MEVMCGSEFHNIMRCCVKKYSFYFLQTYCLIILLGAYSSSCYKMQWMIIPQAPSPAHSWFYNLSNHSKFLLFLRRVLVYLKSFLIESIPYLSSSLSQLYTFTSFTIFIWRRGWRGVLYIGWSACVFHGFLQWHMVSYSAFTSVLFSSDCCLSLNWWV